MPAEWDIPTPSGFVYKTPGTYEELCRQHLNYGMSYVECWDDAEVPPSPTWEMLGLAHKEIEHLEEQLAMIQDQVRYLSATCRYTQSRGRLS